MSAARPVTSPSGAVPGPARPALLGEFLGPLTDGGPWGILDLGPFSTTTLSAFAGSRCRLGVADALAPLAAVGTREDAAIADQRAALGEHLLVDPERPWDRVLLWGLLDYLPDAMLGALVEHLRPGLSARARLHALMMSPGRTVPATPLAYELLDHRQAQVTGPTATATIPTARRSQPQQ